MKKITIALTVALVSAIPHPAFAADAQRHADVANRSKAVMPFSLKKTTHVFTKTEDGGVQRVVARKTADAGQTKLVRRHLQEIREQFLKGDFSGPSHIHGKNMPGLEELRSAKRGQMAIEYRVVDGGAELSYRTSDPMTVAALHKWFDAQLTDHGADAVEGHRHHRTEPRS